MACDRSSSAERPRPWGAASHRRGRLARVVVVAAALMHAASANGARASSIFAMADASEVIARGRVTSVTRSKDGKLAVYGISPERVLKGGLAEDAPFTLVQELLFDTTKPYFAGGERTLVFGVPLPRYSAFREALPEGSHLRWTERLNTSADVATLGDPALVEPLASYLAVRDDPAAVARLLGGLLVSDVGRLRVDALTAIEDRAELAALLDVEVLAGLRPFLADQRVPLAERGQVLVKLARSRAAGIAPIAEEVCAAGGPLRGPALDALVTMGRLPDERRLLGYSRSDDPAVRLAAARGLARLASASALDRIEEMLTSEASAAVRVAAIRALGAVSGERPVRLLAAAGRSEDRAQVTAAAEALGQIATPPAITVLGEMLSNGTVAAQTAAAFALKRTNLRDAIEILETQEQNHPDPDVRRICRLALGESVHEH